jgi:predicted Co/Zn/Cd cation transporter (cation efflux family)
MIGKPEWFSRRKYGGWGFYPKTWQGWVYIIIMVGPFIALQSISALSSETRIIITIIWAVIFGVDAIDIMIRLKKDERERLHEAIAERNAAWFMVIALAIGVAYQVGSSAVHNTFYADPVILIALFGGLLVKLISNVYLEHKA